MKQYYEQGEICPGLGTTCESRCRWDEQKQMFECAIYKQLLEDDRKRSTKLGLWARLKSILGLTPRLLPAGARKFRG